MAYDLAKVTDAGNNLVASILANKSSLSIDKIEVSDTKLPSTTDITKLTSISDVVQTIQANGFLKNENTLIVSSVLDNSKISKDYKAWVFGIWGSDSQNGQSMLMAVITATNAPDTIPAYSGSTPVSYRYNFNIGFSNAGNVQFNMINGSFATNDTVVHTTGDETIDGQKKFKTDPTDSAGNAYAKTVDVNQQLDKKVNVSDMRKPANDVAGIEEVNAKQDKIGYTPADDSKVTHNSSDDAIIFGNNNIFHLRTQLSSKDDIFKINNIGLYQATKVTSANNPLGTGNPISGDCISLYWSFIFVDDNGEVYVETPNTQKWDRKVSENGTNNFHGANNFDTAPILKSNGKPFITVDDVPKPEDTGWQTCNDYQGSSINTYMSLIHYRVFNNVLFITGSVSIQQGADAESNFALKIDKSWKLPDPVDTNTWSAIQQRSIDPNGGIGTVYLNHKAAYDNGYLLAFRGDKLNGFSSSEAAQAHFSFAIPVQ